MPSDGEGGGETEAQGKPALRRQKRLPQKAAATRIQMAT